VPQRVAVLAVERRPVPRRHAAGAWDLDGEGVEVGARWGGIGVGARRRGGRTRWRGSWEGDFLSFTTKETMAQWNARIGLFIWAFPDSAGSWTFAVRHWAGP